MTENMIEKKKKIAILVVFIVIVIAVFYFLARMGEKEQINNSTNLDSKMKTELVDIEEGDIVENEASTSTPETEENIEAVNIDENGVDVRRQASIEAQAREMPFPGIDGMGLEFMNDEEKEEFRVPSIFEAQILTRDFNGKISSYKVVKQAEDIVYPN